MSISCCCRSELERISDLLHRSETDQSLLEQAKEDLCNLQQKYNFDWELTGALGKRTIHQQKETILLVVVVKKFSNCKSCKEEKETNLKQQILLNSKLRFTSNSDGIFSYPQLSDPLEFKCSFIDQAILLLHALHQIKSEPISNPAVREQIRPLLECITEQTAESIDSAVLGCSLYWKCKLDVQNNTDVAFINAGLQMKLLLENWNSICNESLLKTCFPLPSFIEIAEFTVDCLFKGCLFDHLVGLVEAFDLFSQFPIQYLKSLLVLQRKQTALDFIQSFDKSSLTPELLYYRALIGENREEFKESWVLSKYSFFPAIFAFAKSWSNQKRYDLAIESYYEAIKSSNQLEDKFSLNSETQLKDKSLFDSDIQLSSLSQYSFNVFGLNDLFDFGFCLLNSNQEKRALVIFKMVVQRDSDCFLAWANMSSIQWHLNLYEEALNSIKYAVKVCPTSIEMWSSYLTLSLKLSQWFEASYAIEKIKQLNRNFDLSGQVEYLKSNCNNEHILQLLQNNSSL